MVKNITTGTVSQSTVKVLTTLRALSAVRSLNLIFQKVKYLDAALKNVQPN